MFLLEVGVLFLMVQLSQSQNWFSNSGFGFNSAMRSQWGGTSNSESNDARTITCTFEDADITGGLTLRMEATWDGWWGWGSRELIGEFIVKTTEAVTPGSYRLVFTELSRVDASCTTEGLGSVLERNTRGQSGQGWGQSWWWGSGMTTNPAATSTADLSGGDDLSVELGPDDLPFRQLEQYAGRGVGLCTSLTAGDDWKEECTDPIACCKLGYDNGDAMVPPAPTTPTPVSLPSSN